MMIFGVKMMIYQIMFNKKMMMKMNLIKNNLKMEKSLLKKEDVDGLKKNIYLNGIRKSITLKMKIVIKKMMINQLPLLKK